MTSLPQTNKSLGQHWLTDTPTLESIVELADVDNTDTVLEVGPGIGSLTEMLSKRAKNVVAVEFDKRFARSLLSKYGGTNVQVVEQDILRFDTSSLPANYKVVANIPYYLTSNLLRRLLESANPPQAMVLLMQKEVAQRIVAKPGSMSVLAVSVQFYCECSLGIVVPPELFTPPPKVDSQVLVLHLRPEPLFTDVDSDIFFRVVRAGFHSKRKKIKSSLLSDLGMGKERISQLLAQANISPDCRAQELSMQQWHALYKSYISFL